MVQQFPNGQAWLEAAQRAARQGSPEEVLSLVQQGEEACRDDPAVFLLHMPAILAEVAQRHKIDDLGAFFAGLSDNGTNRMRLIHQAFDILPGLVLFGFSETRVHDGSVDSQVIRIVNAAGKIRLYTGDEPVLDGSGKRLQLDDRYPGLPELEREWSREDLERFVRQPASLSAPDLYQRVLNAIQRHVDLPELGAQVILALWVVLSFIYPAFPAVPFLLLVGEKGTGKSQVLDMLAQLCRCGHKSRGTPAALGDMIQSQRTIWLLDQAGSYQPEMLQDVIDSYKAGASRTVVNSDQRGVPHRFSTYAPKAFAAHTIFDMDLADRCIPILMLPAQRYVEPILADDQHLDQLRRALYRHAVVHGPQIFTLPAYTDRAGLGAKLDLSGRTWELFWPLEVSAAWLDIPESHRIAARDFYRKSIPSVKAELDPVKREVLTALMEQAAEASADFPVQSDELERRVRKELPDDFVDATKLGRMLYGFGLVVEKDRPRVNGKRVTSWIINKARLEDQAKRWKVDGALSERL